MLYREFLILHNKVPLQTSFRVGLGFRISFVAKKKPINKNAEVIYIGGKKDFRYIYIKKHSV